MPIRDVLEDVAGPVVFQYRARNWGDGNQTVFWKTGKGGAWTGERSVNIPAEHNGQWCELEALITEEGRISRLRFGMTRKRGLVEIEWIRLLDPKTRKVVHEWDF